MDPTEILRQALQFSHDWIAPLASDLSDAPLTSPTRRGGNHPWWIMGHITFSNAGLAAMISGHSNRLQSWSELFSGGTQPLQDAAIYPAYAEILDEWRSIHQATLALLDGFGPAQLDEPPVAVWEAVSEDPAFQTNGRLFLFIAMHEMSHRGQLADARHVLGRQPFA